MIVRAGTGWQYVMTDLSLILFMVTASALSQAPDAPGGGQPGAGPVARPSSRSEPVAVWRAGPGAPPVSEWLHAQAADPRQQLTVVVQYGPDGAGGAIAEALGEARAIVAQAGEAGVRARIVVEPGSGGAVAALAYDVPPETMARTLQGNGNMSSPKEPLP